MPRPSGMGSDGLRGRGLVSRWILPPGLIGARSRPGWRYGPSKLAEAKKEPGWQAFLRQYKDLMQLVLVGAAVVSVVAPDEWHTAIVVFAVTLLNAILGLRVRRRISRGI
jgi:magnesium-transporting ATPase (P-type)